MCATIRRYESIDQSRADELTTKVDQSLWTRVASDWVRDEKLEKALPNKPTITGGEVVVQKVRELVKA